MKTYQRAIKSSDKSFCRWQQMVLLEIHNGSKRIENSLKQRSTFKMQNLDSILIQRKICQLKHYVLL